MHLRKRAWLLGATGKMPAAGWRVKRGCIPVICRLPVARMSEGIGMLATTKAASLWRALQGGR